MSADESLASLQAAFAATLDDPAADAALAAHLRSAEHDAALHERLGLYRGNVRAARRAALASAYPVLEALVGEAYFDALALAYAKAHPSRDADLNRIGAALPAFIERYETDARYAYFGDVARLEWALHAAAFAADAKPLAPAQWQAIGAERLMSSRLVVHPACAALASNYAALAIWRAHQHDDKSRDDKNLDDAGRKGARQNTWPEDIDMPGWTLVVRPRWRPAALAHTRAAHELFMALQRGATLDEALESAFAVDEAFDFASQWCTWIEAGAIVGLQGE
ncbi:DNA-binding domain-containing protein [Paraburkholderia tagetis]|uniref:DNA-binding domain-containing protein n=1 Tax=Paraburkholderia tagetis TaxID=2913261 RepID=A0A9X1UJ27_9BURK|nr:DNA-binding domain-containing protein [Paraburkholderia tagetis]MCG5075832.1 DNA-binding domain-containing protein [Paraburkholderia tagetis]